MYNTVIFDLDGTLLDTIKDLASSVNRTLIKYNYEPRDILEIKNFVGNGLKKLIELSLPCGLNNPNFDNFFLDFKADYEANCMVNTYIYPGINELLKELKQNNYKLAIVSNKADKVVKKLADHYFKDIFDLSLGEKEGLNKKPHSDMINYVIKTLNLERDKVIYVGDSEVDIVTGNNSSIACISVTWGFRDQATLIKSGAQILVNHPLEIFEYIKKHL